MHYSTEKKNRNQVLWSESFTLRPFLKNSDIMNYENKKLFYNTNFLLFISTSF